MADESQLQNWQDVLSNNGASEDELRARRDPNELVRSVVQNRGALMNREARAAAKFEREESQLPLKEALARARLRKEEASLELQGRAQLYNEWKDTQIISQRAAFYAGLPDLEDFLKKNGHEIGTPDYASAFETYVSKFPWAVNSADVKTIIGAHVKVNDSQAQLKQTLAAVRGETLRPEERVTIGPQGATVTAGATTAPPTGDARTLHAKLTGQIKLHEDQSAAEKAERIKAAQPGTENIPYSEAPKLHGAIATKEQLEKEFPVLATPAATPEATPAAVRRRRFNREKGEIEE